MYIYIYICIYREREREREREKRFMKEDGDGRSELTTFPLKGTMSFLA